MADFFLTRALRHCTAWLRASQASRSPFHDVVNDAVFGQLVWQGYGDGDWWRGNAVIGDSRVAFLIDGDTQPYQELVARAHEIVRTYAVLERAVLSLLDQEAARRPDEAAAIRQLAITSIALFLLSAADEPDGYSGEFVILARHDIAPQDAAGNEWRCDLKDRQPVHLRLWK